MKLNVDGAFQPGENTGGAGMVLRDDTGAIIFSVCHFLHSSTSPLEAELAACLEGVTLALERTDGPLIVEMDCMQGVDFLTEQSVNRSPVASFVWETKSLLYGGRQHKIQHVCRSSNAAAHFMAQMGRSSQRTVVWLG